MIQDEVINEYFEWLVNIACKDIGVVSYRKLLGFLHRTDFVVIDPMDSNRADDGVELRYRFAHDYIEDDDAEYLLTGPCSVLEMMLALSIRCEEIMDDPRFGDRTTQWFWEMVASLGLGGMYDSNFDICHAKEVVMRFLARDYEPDGTGGLFTVRRCVYDMRDMEIWHQLLEYLNTIS
jgi:hypothetical protein